MEIRDYRDLKVWQRAMELAESIYALSQSLPKEEAYGLSSQMRRAAVSVASNIAEGSARRSKPEFARFINIASGSLAELETQLTLAQRIGFIARPEAIFQHTEEIGKMLYALQRSLTEQKVA
jgi:four helix bundle protein